MGIIESLYKTCLYFAMVSCFYIVVKKRYNEKIRVNFNGIYKKELKNGFGIFQMLIFSGLFGAYSVYITASELTSDRHNYAYSFKVGRKLTPAINVIFDAFRCVTDDPRFIFFFISFLMLLLLLVACRINKDYMPQAFLMMVVSNLLIFSYYGLKQAPAIGFVAIAGSLWLRKKYALACGCGIIALLFHESALVFFPVLILLIGAKKRWVRIMEYVLLLIFLIAFPTMTRIVINLLNEIGIPVVNELDGYLNSNGEMLVTTNIWTAFKGIPYYLISIYGIYSRKRIKNKLENYDKYLVMSIFVSIVYMLSMYMYWMWRFAIYFYFFDFVFAAQLIDKNKNKKVASIFYYIVIVVFLFINFRYYMQYFINYGGF